MPAPAKFYKTDMSTTDFLLSCNYKDDYKNSIVFTDTDMIVQGKIWTSTANIADFTEQQSCEINIISYNYINRYWFI